MDLPDPNTIAQTEAAKSAAEAAWAMYKIARLQLWASWSATIASGAVISFFGWLTWRHAQQEARAIRQTVLRHSADALQYLHSISVIAAMELDAPFPGSGFTENLDRAARSVELAHLAGPTDERAEEMIRLARTFVELYRAAGKAGEKSRADNRGFLTSLETDRRGVVESYNHIVTKLHVSYRDPLEHVVASSDAPPPSGLRAFFRFRKPNA